MRCVADIFAALGERLAAFGSDEVSQHAIASAVAANEWFCETDIHCAVEAIRSQMLVKEKITQWLALYEGSSTNTPHKDYAIHIDACETPAPNAIAETSHQRQPLRIAIIMAGNIPLVGFFDLMCVIASGNTPCVKCSGKDSVLMGYIIAQLRDIEPELPIEQYIDGMAVDAVIATGGDNANLYFRSAFADIPHLLRGSRHSVAVLSGRESDADMEHLADDIFTYSGLGCRSVSMIFVPRGCALRVPTRKMCRGYHNNYLQNRALMAMCGIAVEDSGEALFVRGATEFQPALSRIAVAEYDSVSEVERWLEANDGRVQCVVSNMALRYPAVPLGTAQYPALTDYADRIDTMEFLRGLHATAF